MRMFLQRTFSRVVLSTVVVFALAGVAAASGGVVQNGKKGANAFDILVSMFNGPMQGKTITLTVQPSTTIGTLKQMIQEKFGLPPAQQKLIWGEKVLDDNDKDLSALGIVSEVKIKVMNRLAKTFPSH